MANKNLFKVERNTPKSNVVNRAGGTAYKLEGKAALAQLAATSCFNGTFYASAQNLLEEAKKSALAVPDAEFIAKTAIYSREHGYMKDFPAFLTAYLRTLDTKLFHKVFDRVIDNGKMLRNFIQILRSGTFSQSNITSGAARSAIQRWFDNHSAESIFRASVGNNPSMKEILKVVRPTPSGDDKAALFAYLLDRPVLDSRFVTRGKNDILYSNSWDNLPALVKHYERFKLNKFNSRDGLEVPNVDFRMLDSLQLSDDEWKEIARNAKWMMTRMNLNTFERHGVFRDKDMVRLIADRLRNPEEIKRAKAFPYQLMTAYLNCEVNIPEIQDALQDAMEIAVDNTPIFDGQVYIFVDVSGSMGAPITGNRGVGTSKVRCVDVAALFGSSILRKNRSAQLFAFDTKVHSHRFNPRDTVITNAQTLARFGGGGTNCSLGLAHLNSIGAKGDLVIYVSDNESWIDSRRTYYYGGITWGSANPGAPTGMQTEWEKFYSRNKGSKLVCIDLVPNTTTQVTERPNILNVGGFSDNVWSVIEGFVKGGNSKEYWVKQIEQIEV